MTTYKAQIERIEEILKAKIPDDEKIICIQGVIHWRKD
jgi:hypothetical protein